MRKKETAKQVRREAQRIVYTLSPELLPFGFADIFMQYEPPDLKED